MAFRYTVTQFERGDKVVCNYLVEDQDGAPLPEVLTIASVIEVAWDLTYLVFKGIPGEYNKEDFRLHPDTPIRNIDPQPEE